MRHAIIDKLGGKVFEIMNMGEGVVNIRVFDVDDSTNEDIRYKEGEFGLNESQLNELIKTLTVAKKTFCTKAKKRGRPKKRG